MSFHPLDIRRDISRKTRILLAFLSWGMVVLFWFLLTRFGNLPPFSLPRPMGVVAAFARLCWATSS